MSAYKDLALSTLTQPRHWLVVVSALVLAASAIRAARILAVLASPPRLPASRGAFMTTALAFPPPTAGEVRLRRSRTAS